MMQCYLATDKHKIWLHHGRKEADVHHQISILKKWFEKQPHLPEIPCEIKIHHFLANCKFSTERVKKHLDTYYTAKSLMPEIFQHCNPFHPEMSATYEVVCCVPLPRLTSNHHRITIIKASEVDPEMFEIYKTLAQCYLHSDEVRMMEEDLSNGDEYLFDLTHVKIAHVKAFQPKMIKKINFILKEVWGKDLKGFHFINVPNFAEPLIRMCKTFFDKELREKIYVQESLEDLYKIIPKNILPSDYGGDEPSLEELNDMWKCKLKDYQDRYDALSDLKVNEELRPSECVNSDITGYYGSYMKIETE